MTGFVIAALVMVAIGLAWMVLPLLRGGARAKVDRTAVNLGILKDQLAELEAEHARGAIADEQYAATKADLQQRVLDETQAEPAAAEAPRVTQVGKLTAAAVVLIVPIASAMMYVRFGDLSAFNPLARQGAEAAHQFSPDDLEKMTRRLAERLKREPDNANGWLTLARTYYSMNRFAEAAAAFEKLVELVPDDASLLADYADSLAMAQGRKIAGKPLELINRALKIDPLQWKALAMAGTEAFDRKDYKSAVELWEKLQASLPPEAPMKQQLTGSINEARSRAGMPQVAAAPPAAAPPAGPAAAPKPAAEAAASSGRVGGTVTLSAELRAKVGPDDSVIIFARPASGTRMPLALTRVLAKELPKTFSLDDSMAMSPEFTLSKFDEVIVGARVSKSGSPMPQKGDFEGLSKPVKVGRADVAITIDTELR
ncbi:MAG: c-type cytochrome biogenesis protein CcmI [Burkholderiales bacterium]|nr:MAG: c-type cytochrome biogenesis protein CcmI [Burkholderiales bacterium]